VSPSQLGKCTVVFIFAIQRKQVSAQAGPVELCGVLYSHMPPSPKPLISSAQTLQAQFSKSLSEGWTWMEHTKKIRLQLNL
jgi:hypothetical protein